MPSSAEVVTVNGGVSTTIRQNLPPGPGMFESRVITEGEDRGKYGWFAAMIPQTKMERNPLNPERWMDVVMYGPDNKPMLRPDPVAMETITKERGVGATYLPIIKSPEEKNPLKEQMASLIESQKETNKTLMLLVQVMAGKVPVIGTNVPVAGEPVVAKRRGRPPKEG